jgi:tetratricopeptide (TPR) repeat protein
MKRSCTTPGLAAAIALTTLVGPLRAEPPPAATNAPVEPQAGLVGEYGISLALGGRLDEAETAFLSQLSLKPHDASALNNIGNLYFLRNDQAVALVFYDRALAIDSTDAGVLINRSLSLLALGDEAGASAAAARAVVLAGGIEKAQSLMAIESDGGTERAAEGGAVSKASVRDLLKKASLQVPAKVEADSSAGADSTGTAGKGRKPQAWRSAGPRAAEAVTTPATLYWRR